MRALFGLVGKSGSRSLFSQTMSLTQKSIKKIEAEILDPQKTIVWKKTDNPEQPYKTQIDGHDYYLRVNDFPEKPLYTLMKGSTAILNLNSRLSSWVFKGASDESSPSTAMKR